MFIEIGSIPTWWYFTAMALAALIIGVAKSGFGGGIGIIAVPLVANALPVDRAIGVLLPILILADVVAVYYHHREASWRHLRPTFIGAAIGIALGTAVLLAFQQSGMLEPALNITVGSICVFFVGLQCYRLAGGKVPRIADSFGSAVGAGSLAGVVSTLAHSAGPVMSIFLLEHRLEKRRMVGTLVLYFFVVNLAKLPTYIGLSYITWPTLKESLTFALLIPLGSVAGLWMHKRIPEKPFTLVMYLGAAAAGANMLFKGLVG